MEGKVKCSGCGHSWDKSDSSKKDMFICHQCGKDNVMKNGGWLSKYNDGGFVQPNANDSKVSMSEDFVGLGYNTKGRNYSPAWGGQFQDGGFIPASPQEQISSALQPTSSDQQASPYLQKKDPVEFYKSFINSPEYARRQLLTGYSASPKDEEYGIPSAAASRKTRLASLENIDPITYDTRQPSDAKPGLYGGPSYININPSDYAGTSREAIEAHELGHLAGATTPGQFNRPGSMSAMEQDIFRKSMLPMKEPVLSGVQGSKEREASLRNLEDFIHLQKPEESKADLNALRFMMYDKGIYDITKGKKFTETDFEKAKQNLGKDRVFKRLTDRVGKKNFVNLMNIIASADDEEATPIAMNGASMPGSVGFTYARTASSAPSEGKYAKKTMASAQKGKDIKKDATNVAASDKIAQLELLQSPEYQYLKYLQSQPQLRQSPGMGEQIMRSADVVTDLMQLGNFIPNPVAQGIGRAGNIIGGGIDLVQAGMSAAEGDYLDAAINAASVGLARGIGANTFRRNSKYLQPGQTLYPLSPQSFGSLNRTKYIEPFQKVKGMTDKSLLANRALLGLVGAETVYDAVPQKEYGGDIPSAQNGQEMRFYQNGLDFKPKGMQDGGEIYEGLELPEFTVTPYDEQYPFYKDLSSEEKKYINDKSAIGRGVRAIATTGKRGQTAKDISRVVKDVEKFGYEATGIPGTIRFANDPVKNLKGTGKTLLDLGVAGSFGPFAPSVYGAFGGYNPITGEELFNQQNLEGAFNTLDTFGMASAIATPLTKPVQIGAKSAGKLIGKVAKPHITSISNIANETLDGIQAVNTAKQLERISMADVPVLPGIDKVKDVRNFGKEINELDSKIKNAKLSELGSLREKFTKLSEQAKEIESAGVTDYKNKLNFINNKLKELSNFKPDDFIEKVKNLGADENTINLLKSDTDLAAQYSNRVSFLDDLSLSRELVDQDLLFDVQYARNTSNIGKTSDFRPRKTSTSLERIDPNTGNLEWSTSSSPLKRVGNKIYDDTWQDDKFYSYPFYKNVGDKIIDAYSNLRLSGSPVISSIPESSDALELMPSLFADQYNVGSMLRQASKFIDETPDGLMFPASSLSGDSYPLALNMMARELKNNPDSQLRLLGFGKSNSLGFADRMNNPELLTSELSQIINKLEDLSGQTLPKPYMAKGKNVNSVVLPKFAVSKGSTNKAIQEYLENTSIADRLGVKRPVIEVIDNRPLNMTRGSNELKDGGVVKDDNGYLNPDNFGKVVEIDSNDITMQGVNQPLLGISDTGDTKLMKPGKNYKFKGKKVTEFPVAKDGGWLDSYRSGGSVGINQLDAQPMKKLNQLLNFTNNPDKDNWLNKYN